MKVPRGINGADLARVLRVLGYERVRQDGSHIRLTTEVNGTHHVMVPNHRPERCLAACSNRSPRTTASPSNN